MEHEPASRPLTVLESFGPPHGRTNPYLVQLFASFPDPVHAQYFSWGRALRGDYDVFHVHWPEVLVRGSDRLRTTFRCVVFLLTLIRIRVTRRALVRTLHNRQPHERPDPVQRALIRLCDRWTTGWIVLNRETPPPTTAPATLAPIGHYREWFDTGTEDTGDDPTSVRGRLVHFGLVRRYKGIDVLLRAVAGLDDPEVTLHVIGSTTDEELAAQLRAAQAGDARITWFDEYVPDPVLRAEVLAAELVVLPFSDITNSSSLVLALSLDRPVLVPRAGATSEIAEEVGPGWVHLYDGALTPQLLADTLGALRATPPASPPDLTRRDWDHVGALHAAAFEQACDVVGRRADGTAATHL